MNQIIGLIITGAETINFRSESQARDLDELSPSSGAASARAAANESGMGASRGAGRSGGDQFKRTDAASGRIGDGWR